MADVIIRKNKGRCRETLKLSYYGIRNDALRMVYDEIKYSTSVKKLRLQCNQISNVTPLAESLMQNSTLKKLYLNGNQIANVTPLAEALRYNTSLRKLDLSYNRIIDIAPLFEALRFNTSLKMLNLNFNGISNVVPILEALRSNNTLERICMMYNAFPVYQEDEICKMLSINRSNALKKKTCLFDLTFRKCREYNLI